MGVARRTLTRCGFLSSLTLALTLALLLGAMVPTVALGRSPGHPQPNAISPYPEGGPRSRSAAAGDVGVDPRAATAVRSATQSSLGESVAATVTLETGRRKGYQFNSAGRRIGLKTVTLMTDEAASASRRWTKGTDTYYLLNWGSLNHYWVKLGPGASVVAITTWKILVLVYRATNLDFVNAAGEARHLEAVMSPGTEHLMVEAAEFAPGLVNSWSAGRVAQVQSIVYPDHPLTQLSPLGGGAYWLGPWDVAADVASYAPPITFDGVVVIWQPWDADDYISSSGWALSLAPSAYSNGAAYTTITAPPARSSWWITGLPFRGEVFVHEWLHGVVDYYLAHGATIPDLHSAPSYGYVDEGGTWSRWYVDLMLQRLRDPITGASVGINLAVWQSGTPSTRP